MATRNNIRPLWYVNVVAVDEDGNKPRIAPAGQQGELEVAVPQPARPRNRNEGQPVDLERAQRGGYGFHMQRSTNISTAFTTVEAAQEYAQDLAMKNPKTAYGIYGCIGVYETTVPTIIQKKFNDAGELVLEKENEAAH